jgi:alpha-1,6-mannosyltransferase
MLMVWGAQSLFGGRSGSSVLGWVLTTQVIAWAAWLWIFRSPTLPVPHIGWAIAFRGVAALSAPLLEDDWARYLWDGWRFIESGSPYGVAPLAFFQDPTVPELLQRRLSEINHPNLPTIYGPTFQLGFGLAAWIAPGALWPWKLMVLAADIGTLLLLRSMAGPRAAVLYGWCPLAIHESVVNVHADILAILPLVAAWHACQRNRWILAGSFLGIAASGKPFALVAFPFFLGLRHGRGWAAAFVTFLALHAPFWMQKRTSTSLMTFAQDWEFNSSLVGVLGLFLPPSWARAVPLAAALPIVLVLWLRHSRSREHPPLHLAYGTLFLASAVVNPWYLLWMLPFAAASPSLTPWVAMAAVSLSYATALNLGITGPGPYSHPAWVRPMEYGLILAAALAEYLLKRTRGGDPANPDSTPPTSQPIG